MRSADPKPNILKVWKFLADHTNHHIDVRLEHEMSEEMWGYQNIGGDRDNDISFDRYLEGWIGLHQDLKKD